MNRRLFVEKFALLGSAALLPKSGFSGSKSKRYKMGLQLFSVHDDMMNDPYGTLKAAKTMGYEDFETFGFDAEKGTFYGQKASEFRKRLNDFQLTVSSGHFGFSDYLEKADDQLMRFVDQCIEAARALNMSYITWPWLSPEQRTIDHFTKLAGRLNRIGERVTAADLGFAYHNHGFEFIDQDGRNGYDIILRETDAALVKLQIDMYWVMHSSKRTPRELIADQPGRYVMWHIKDMDKLTRDYTELGNGSINYAEILPDPVVSGLEFYYLEQGGNYAHTPMRSAADSAAYFKEHLRRYF